MQAAMMKAITEHLSIYLIGIHSSVDDRKKPFALDAHFITCPPLTNAYDIPCSSSILQPVYLGSDSVQDEVMLDARMRLRVSPSSIFLRNHVGGRLFEWLALLHKMEDRDTI